MELPPGDKVRIEQEEQRLAAEEQYRAEVRAKLQGESSPVKKKPILPWIVGIGLGLIVVAIVWSRVDTATGTSRFRGDGANPVQAAKPSPVPKTRFVPVDQKIASGQIMLKARGYVQLPSDDHA